MTDLNSTKFKHLTLDDRTEIQMCLDRGVTFKAIAARVGKDQTTISKEVKRHIKVNPNSAKKFDKHGNPIANICPLLVKAPFVCNLQETAHSVWFPEAALQREGRAEGLRDPARRSP